MPIRAAFLLAACTLLQDAPAWADPWTVCVLESEFVPLTEYEGPGQFLVRTALDQAGEGVVFIGAPWRRCLSGVSAGKFDAVIGAAATPAFLPFMGFPLKDGSPDPAASLGHSAHMVLRLRGSKVNWNGRTFEGSNGTVHFPAGAAIVSEKLALLRVSSNDSVKTGEQLLGMLLIGRAETVVLRASEATALLKQARFRDQVEMLETPFVIAYAYLGVRRSLLQSQPAVVHGVWNGIARLRAEAGWAETETQYKRRASAWIDGAKLR